MNFKMFIWALDLRGVPIGIYQEKGALDFRGAVSNIAEYLSASK